MRFGLFGSAEARRGGPDVGSGVGFWEFVDYNVEAESLGFCRKFLVEHHFTGFGQISATLNLLTFITARSRTLRLGHGSACPAPAQPRAPGRASRHPRLAVAR